MVLLKNKNKCNDNALVTIIVRKYFEYLRLNKFNLNCDEIAELLRYSMCIALNLSSKGFNTKVEEYGVDCAKSLKSILSGVDNKSEDFRQGILEACVHSMQMSLSRVKDKE